MDAMRTTRTINGHRYLFDLHPTPEGPGWTAYRRTWLGWRQIVEFNGTECHGTPKAVAAEGQAVFQSFRDRIRTA
jgi:hypothetical protein